MDGTLRSRRKPNFSEMENLFLIEEFERNKEVLRSKVNSTEMNRRKLRVWQNICDGLNIRNSLVKRSVDEVRRKWKNMVTVARKDTAQYNPAKPPSQVNQRIMRGYSDSEYSPSQEVQVETKPNLSVSPTRNDTNSPGETYRNLLVQNHEDNDDEPALCKISLIHSNLEQPVDNSCGPRIDEVRAAVGCGMEIVQPGPPAAALTEQARQSMRTTYKPKRNNIQSILFNAKRRKLQANQSLATSSSFDLQQLQKEKLIMEKEKIVLEKEKLMLEKEKLVLEIQCLRNQLQSEESEY